MRASNVLSFLIMDGFGIGLIKLIDGDVMILHEEGCAAQTDDVIAMWVSKAYVYHLHHLA